MPIKEKLAVSTKKLAIPHFQLPESPTINTRCLELRKDEYLELLASEDQIQQRVKHLADLIAQDYKNLLPDVVIVAIEPGGSKFLELLRKANPDFFSGEAQYQKIKSYFGAQTTGELHFLPPFFDPQAVNRKHVLIVEDIADTNLTLSGMIERLREQSSPASIKIVVLLNKIGVEHKINLDLDYCGLTIPNLFVVGGRCLDYFTEESGERFRDLPDLWV